MLNSPQHVNIFAVVSHPVTSDVSCFFRLCLLTMYIYFAELYVTSLLLRLCHIPFNFCFSSFFFVLESAELSYHVSTYVIYCIILFFASVLSSLLSLIWV